MPRAKPMKNYIAAKWPFKMDCQNVAEWETRLEGHINMHTNTLAVPKAILTLTRITCRLGIQFAAAQI